MMHAVKSTGAGPWQPPGSARSLHWWDERGFQSLSKALQDLLAAWQAAWGIHGELATLGCEPAGKLPGVTGDWAAFQATAGGAQAWLCLPNNVDRSLVHALFPGGTAGPLSLAVAGSCRQDAVSRLSVLFGLVGVEEGADPPQTSLSRVGSGAVEADLEAPLGARLLLGPEIAARWRQASRKQQARPREPLVPATEASAHRPLLLEVELEGCELEVGALQGLQVGDVVRLDHGLQRPAAVRHGEAALCNAFLGRRGNRKAVELAGHVHPATEEVLR